MKSITSNEPLTYSLTNSSVVTALPYIDQNIPDLQNKVQYLIRGEEKKLPFDSQLYLKNLQLPNTPLINSTWFTEQVEQVMKRLSTTDKKKEKNFDFKVAENDHMGDQVRQKIQHAKIKHGYNLIKQANLQLDKKLAPFLFKEQISALEKRKSMLVRKIEEEKRAIEEINKKRKYEQLEAEQRELTISSRTQIMIHKNIKMEGMSL